MGSGASSEFKSRKQMKKMKKRTKTVLTSDGAGHPVLPSSIAEKRKLLFAIQEMEEFEGLESDLPKAVPNADQADLARVCTAFSTDITLKPNTDADLSRETASGEAPD
eukprot:s315_g21.t1